MLQKEPIKIPKAVPQRELEPVSEPEAEPEPVHVVKSVVPQQQPDVIPTQKESVQPEIIEILPPPPEAFSSNPTEQKNGHNADDEPKNAEEQIYSNINYEEQQYANLPNQLVAVTEGQSAGTTAIVGTEDCDLSEYIEDTKVQAMALYDYQASAEDEISFDPNDIITHIEQVRHT